MGLTSSTQLSRAGCEATARRDTDQPLSRHVMRDSRQALAADNLLEALEDPQLPTLLNPWAHAR